MKALCNPVLPWFVRRVIMIAICFENDCYFLICASSFRVIIACWVNTHVGIFFFDPTGNNGCSICILNTQIGNLLVFNDSISVIIDNWIHPTAEHAAPEFLGRQSCQWGWAHCIPAHQGGFWVLRTSSSCLTVLCTQRQPSFPAWRSVCGIKSSGRWWAPVSKFSSPLLTAEQGRAGQKGFSSSVRELVTDNSPLSLNLHDHSVSLGNLTDINRFVSMWALQKKEWGPNCQRSGGPGKVIIVKPLEALKCKILLNWGFNHLAQCVPHLPSKSCFHRI